MFTYTQDLVSREAQTSHHATTEVLRTLHAPKQLRSRSLQLITTLMKLMPH